MKNFKKIKLSGKAEVLNEFDMKHILGGSMGSNGTYDCFRRNYDGSGGGFYNAGSINSAAAWCGVWSAAGYKCSCKAR